MERGVFAALLALLLLAAALPISAADKDAVAAPRTHSQLLATYLHKLPQYIEWPKETFADEQTPFVIGIVGDDPFQADSDIADGTITVRSGEAPMQAILRRIGAGETIRIKSGDKSLIVRRLVVKVFQRPQEEVASCHLLFVSANEKRWPDVLKLLDKSSVLTVGEAPEFIDRDGMINCVARKTVDGKEKMALGVNLTAARRNNLKLDSALYSAAERRIKG
jgi:hypothetical protein